MGIRGLTTYVKRNENIFFQSCDLRDCNVVIDGSGLSNLYNSNIQNWKTEYSNDCYGGDFDKFGEIIIKFFKLLRNCNITPYIVFYGPTEDFKIDEKKADLKEKVDKVRRLTPNLIREILANSSRDIPPHLRIDCPTPAGLKYVQEDITKALKLNIFSSNSKVDAANEMACLAKQLNCPVMSMNSDFYLYGADYIPLQSIYCRFNMFRVSRFLSCKMFKIANLIRALKGAPRTEYLLPVLLGNKIIDRNCLDKFFSRVKIYGKNRVELAFNWIRRQQSLQSAIEEILTLTSDDQNERLTIYKKIKAAMIIYMPISVDHIKDHFGLVTSRNGGDRIDFIKLENDLGLKIEEDPEHDETVPFSTELFLRKYRKCQYPAFFLFMLRENKYYIYRDVEDFHDSDANEVAFPIMAAIHKTLVQNNHQQLTVLMRNTERNLEEFEVPLCQVDVPSIEDIEGLSVEERQRMIIDILGIYEGFLEVINKFPPEWHLLLLSLKYYTLNKRVWPSCYAYAYSFVLCFILLKYDTVLSVSDPPQNKDILSFSPTMIDRLKIKLKKAGIFKMNPRENNETFDRSIIHITSELKCIFIHLKFLNALYNFAFKDAFLHEIFDGTFIYNMTVWFKEQPNIRDSVGDLCDEDEKFLQAYRFVIRVLEEQDII